MSKDHIVRFRISTKDLKMLDAIVEAASDDSMSSCIRRLVREEWTRKATARQKNEFLARLTGTSRRES